MLARSISALLIVTILAATSPSMLHGVVVHDHVELPHATTSSPLSEGPEPGPINLQDHNSEVRYRNVWFVEK